MTYNGFSADRTEITLPTSRTFRIEHRMKYGENTPMLELDFTPPRIVTDYHIKFKCKSIGEQGINTTYSSAKYLWPRIVWRKAGAGHAVEEQKYTALPRLPNESDIDIEYICECNTSTPDGIQWVSLYIYLRSVSYKMDEKKVILEVSDLAFNGQPYGFKIK